MNCFVSLVLLRLGEIRKTVSHGKAWVRGGVCECCIALVTGLGTIEEGSWAEEEAMDKRSNDRQ